MWNDYYCISFCFRNKQAKDEIFEEWLTNYWARIWTFKVFLFANFQGPVMWILFVISYFIAILFWSSNNGGEVLLSLKEFLPWAWWLSALSGALLRRHCWHASIIAEFFSFLHGLILQLTLLPTIYIFFASWRAAEFWFKEARERHETLNAIIYGNIIYANWFVFSFLFFFSPQCLDSFHSYIKTEIFADFCCCMMILEYLLEDPLASLILW